MSSNLFQASIHASTILIEIVKYVQYPRAMFHNNFRQMENPSAVTDIHVSTS